PGTVIISAAGEVADITKTVSPVLSPEEGSKLIYIDFSRDTRKLGGSSFAQIINQLGDEVPSITDAAYFTRAFEAVQQLVREEKIAAGHDIASGGLITTLLEMC